MADTLTQLQDAVDQLFQQFVASLFYVNKHHALEKLGPKDNVRQETKNDGESSQPKDLEVDSKPPEVFKAGQRELAQDLILKEQQIELLISMLPGLENNERDQEQTIRQLEEELKAADEERKAAVKEKEEVLARLENVIRSIKRP